MADKTLPIAGGCLCGAVRFEASEPPSAVGVCHCRICQRSSGGPHMVWAFLPRASVRFTRGAPAYHRSSSWAERGFCGSCGSPLIFRDGTDSVSVPVGALDHPEDWPPDFGHGGMESRIPWDRIADDLPRTRTDEDPAVQKSIAAADRLDLPDRK